MSNYIEIKSDVIESFLKSKGFVRGIQGAEIVYDRKHSDNPNITIRVYTSIRNGSEAARAVGKDAIRITAFFDDGKKSFGMFKGTRVYRVTSEKAILERMYERMQEAYKICNQWILKNNGSLANSHRERVQKESQILAKESTI